MDHKLKLAERRNEPVFYLEKLDTAVLEPFKQYFNTLNANNKRSKILYGHEPFVDCYWFPFPWMFREEKYNFLLSLPHFKKLKEIYDLSVPLFLEVEKLYKDYKIIKLEINLMPSNTKVNTHVDKWGVLSNCIRVHIPIQTNPNVIFTVDNKSYHIPEGQIFEFNNQIWHSVENTGDCTRIHYVFDLVEKDSIQIIENFILSNGLTKGNHIFNWQKSIRKEWH